MKGQTALNEFLTAFYKNCDSPISADILQDLAQFCPTDHAGTRLDWCHALTEPDVLCDGIDYSLVNDPDEATLVNKGIFRDALNQASN